MANREKLRHVAMVAKFLDDNKLKTSLKKWILTVSNFIHLIVKCWRNFSWFECESVEKEKENFCAVFTNSIKCAHGMRKLHVAVVQRGLRSVLLLIKPIVFLPLSLPSPSSLLKLSLIVIQKFCYHGNVTPHFCLFNNYSSSPNGLWVNSPTSWSKISRQNNFSL